MSRHDVAVGRDTGRLRSTFRSLRTYNYRVWAGGALISNTGTWMQRIAQDWLVLTGLTQHNATAVGVVMGLQFGPQVLLLPLTGYAADRFDRRRVLMTTQACLGLLAIGLGLLTVTGVVQLWHVYVFAFLFGCVSAFDSPANQTFVAELVGEEDLPNAVALNSASFNAARMIGPVAAGLLIGAFGTGWAFLINGVSFAAVIAAILLLRRRDLLASGKAVGGKGGLAGGFRYIWQRPDLKAILLIMFLIGTFGLSFPVYISTMSVGVFHANASQYGFLTAMMAVGTFGGALMSASRGKPRFRLLVWASAVFGTGYTLAAFMPSYWLFGGSLVIIGGAAMTLTTSTNSLMQLSTEPAMRGRVMAIRLAIALGGTPIGAPIAGWAADRFGPRYALGIGAAAGFAAMLAGLRYLAKYARKTG